MRVSREELGPVLSAGLRFSPIKLLILDGSWLMLTYRPLSCMMSRHTPFMSGYPRLHQIALSMIVRRSFGSGMVSLASKTIIQLGDIGIVDFLVAHFAPAERIVKPV